VIFSPPPTTFAEGQRRIYGIAAGIAGVCFGLAVLIGAAIVVFGDWGAANIRLQLYILAGLVAAGTANTTIVIIGLLVGGPVGRMKANVSKESVSVEAEGDVTIQN
jgi:hypothetical protein